MQGESGLKGAWVLVVVVSGICLGGMNAGAGGRNTGANAEGYGYERRGRRGCAEVAEGIPKKFPSMEGYAEGGGWSAAVACAAFTLLGGGIAGCCIFYACAAYFDLYGVERFAA